MAKEQTKQTVIDEFAIKAAIEAVKGLGRDLNPYTVAEEANVQAEDIYRNSQLMRLILEARGNDFDFSSADDEEDLLSIIDELNQERDALKQRVEDLENKQRPKTADFPNPEEINKQVKELLESETENEIKALEDELDRAYTQTAQAQEENLELTHCITGLEKVNEALNARLRELEDKIKVLESNVDESSSADEGSSEKADERQKLIEENDALTERVKEVEGQNDELNESSLTLQHKIISLENKLAELQQESESLAMQLQNAFHTSYEKGLQEGLKRSQPAPAVALGEVIEPQPIIQELPEFEPSLDTGPLPATERLLENQSDLKEMEATAVTGEHPQLQAEPASQSFPPIEPETEISSEPSREAMEISTATDRAVEQTVVESEPDAAVDPVSASQDKIHNFTQAGPYTASEFNPLQDLRWRDLETVYDMGVLAVKDFENRPAASDSNIDSDQQTTGNRIPAFSDTTIFSEESMDLTGSSDSLTPLPPEAYGGAPKQIEEPADVNVITDPIPDFDQLDIFEDMEELEELGKIEVPEDLLADIPIDEVQKRKAQGLPISEKPEQTDEELRELVENRIKQAKEHTVDQAVRTPPAPGSNEEGGEKGGYSGLNKFVGGKSHPQGEGAARISQSGIPAARVVPPEIRRHCQILGIQEIEGLSREVVTDAWKKLIALPGVHPDQGGDTESAIYLNTAKDALLRYIDDSAPKLGKKFGSQSSKEMSNRFTGRKKQEG